MRVYKSVILGSAASVLAIPAIASAQTTAPTSSSPSAGTGAAPSSSAAALGQGTTVYDVNGGTVGTIESTDGEFAVLATTKSKVRLPKNSFGAGAKGPVIGMTAAQLDQAAAQAAPQASAAAAKPNVVKGAAVADTQGGAVGTIADVDAQFATVTLTTGSKVRLPVTAFGAGDNGGLRIAMTAAQLSAAAGAAGSGSKGS